MAARLIAYMIVDGLFFLAGVYLIGEYGRAIFPALAAIGVILLLAQATITVVARRGE